MRISSETASLHYRSAAYLSHPSFNYARPRSPDTPSESIWSSKGPPCHQKPKQIWSPSESDLASWLRWQLEVNHKFTTQFAFYNVTVKNNAICERAMRIFGICVCVCVCVCRNEWRTLKRWFPFLFLVFYAVKTIDYGLKGTLILPLCPACLTPSNSNCTSLLVHISLFCSPSLYFFHTLSLWKSFWHISGLLSVASSWLWLVGSQWGGDMLEEPL